MSTTSMSHSTTATSAYIVLKYSKSYPPNPSIQTEQNPSSIQTGSGRDTSAEWEHFVNPIIRLVLDVKKSSNSVLESVRLRILWSMNSGDVSMNTIDQREVVFEDLELLSFSPLPSHKPHQKQLSQGLPLKAVYRDSVVGIRYLHPFVPTADSGTTPIYRRFQITFTSPSAASQFIDTIRTVCPCKANPTPAQGREVTIATNPVPHILNASAHRTVTNAPPPHLDISLQNCAGHIPTFFTPTPHRLSVMPRPRMNTIAQGSALDILSSPSFALPSSQNDGRPKTFSSSPLNLDNSSPGPSSSLFATPLIVQSNRDTPSTHQLHNQPQFTDEQNRAISQITIEHPLHKLIIAPNHPSHAEPPPSANSDNGTMRPPPPSANLHDNIPPPQEDPFIVSLRNATSLYDLPVDTLEHFVCDVVREEGFIKLLENIASMWRVKSILGQ